MLVDVDSDKGGLSRVLQPTAGCFHGDALQEDYLHSVWTTMSCRVSSICPTRCFREDDITRRTVHLAILYISDIYILC